MVQELLSQYNIQIEVQEDSCHDSFHDNFYLGSSRDGLLITFPNYPRPALICIGCHILRFPRDEGSSPVEEEIEQNWGEAYEKKNTSTVMSKRASKRKCVLCGKVPETKDKVGGLRFCNSCAEKVGDQLGNSTDVL